MWPRPKSLSAFTSDKTETALRSRGLASGKPFSFAYQGLKLIKFHFVTNFNGIP